MLDSRYAMWMLWGPELTFFWSGFPEETYHTFSYSPVYDDESRISGMLCVVTEVTERIIGERRLKILRDLASRAIGSASVEERCRGACQVLAQHPFSVPFAGVYLLDPSSRLARRVAHTRAMPSYEPLYVLGDFARLVQCVGNVLSNAVKYTEPGGQISIRTGVEDSTAFIEVSDTGMGIPGELLSSVFDLFVQSERTLDRAQGGLGIGLAVVKRLVEMHEGVVHARSDGAGRGSTFEIRLPRIARPEAAAQSATPFKAEPQRVLIVDDNADAANSLSMLLAFEGHQTQVAYNAAEALACIECFRPEVALLDIGLPEMDGYELAKRLRAIPQMNGLRIIALTGYGQAEDRQRVLHQDSMRTS